MRSTLPLLAANVVLRRPTSAVFFVTNRCNLDCEMCFYTSRERRPELSIDEIRILARSMPAQWYLMLTGGEPFIRPDLPEIAAAFYDRGAVNLHISTNATLRDRTISGIRAIASYARNARVLVVSSIDGPASVHDRIRARSGAFARTIETLSALLDLRTQHRNLAVLANFTFTALNQDCWKETFDYLLDELGVDTVNVGLVRGTVKNAATKDIDLTGYRRAVAYLRERGNRRGYFPASLTRLAYLKDRLQTDTIARIAAGETPTEHHCLAGRVFGVITETGDVYPCEMLGDRIGNLRDVDMDFMRLWRSRTARAVRQYIDRQECLCTYECAMGATLAASARTPVRLLAQAARGGDPT